MTLPPFLKFAIEIFVHVSAMSDRPSVGKTLFDIFTKITRHDIVSEKRGDNSEQIS